MAGDLPAREAASVAEIEKSAPARRGSRDPTGPAPADAARSAPGRVSRRQGSKPPPDEETAADGTRRTEPKPLFHEETAANGTRRQGPRPLSHEEIAANGTRRQALKVLLYEEIPAHRTSGLARDQQSGNSLGDHAVYWVYGLGFFILAIALVLLLVALSIKSSRGPNGRMQYEIHKSFCSAFFLFILFYACCVFFRRALVNLHYDLMN